MEKVNFIVKKTNFKKAMGDLIWKSKQKINTDIDIDIGTDIEYVEFYELCVQIAKDKEMAEKYAKLKDELIKSLLGKM